MADRIIKPWGWSQEVYRDELTRVVRIHVEPGGFCSWHKHERQFNLFVVMFGHLLMEKKVRESSRPGIQYANPGHDDVYVNPAMIHRFTNPHDDLAVEALEIYTSADGSPPDENDIIRFSEGGIKAAQKTP